MKRLKAIAASLGLAVVLLSSSANAQHIIVGGGGGGGGIPGLEVKANVLTNGFGVIFAAGMEYSVPQMPIALELQVGGYSYNYWEGDYNEWGSGSLVAIMSRFYQMPGNMGSWFGAGITFIDGTFGWDDWGTSGYGWVSGVAPTISGGFKFTVPGSPVVFDPNAVLVIIPDASSDMSVIFGAGCAVGFTF